MEWRSRKPSFSGWYWKRKKATRTGRVLVSYDPEVVEVQFQNHEAIVFAVNSDPLSLDSFDKDEYEWCGPLEVPT